VSATDPRTDAETERRERLLALPQYALVRLGWEVRPGQVQGSIFYRIGNGLGPTDRDSQPSDVLRREIRMSHMQEWGIQILAVPAAADAVDTRVQQLLGEVTNAAMGLPFDHPVRVVLTRYAVASLNDAAESGRTFDDEHDGSDLSVIEAAWNAVTIPGLVYSDLERLAFTSGYRAASSKSEATRVQQLTEVLRGMLAVTWGSRVANASMLSNWRLQAERVLAEFDALEAGERDNTGLEAIRGWLCSDEALYVGSMDGDALDALALRLFTTAGGLGFNPKEDA
jgi:hypothetical protein